MSFGRSRRKNCRVPMTGLHPCRIPHRHCWPVSIGFTASRPAPNRSEASRITSALSLTKTQAHDGGEDETMTNRTLVGGHRALRLLSAAGGLSIALGACTIPVGDVTSSVPDDYRQRHPIAIHEA